MSTYEPGTVAVATVDGEVQRIFRTGENEWCDTAGFGRLDEEISNVRPLVVLDLDDPNLSGNASARRINLLEHLRRGTTISKYLADQIEAQTKPPRIPEPGPWGVVEARGAARQDGEPSLAQWVRDYGGTWRRTDNGFGVGWLELTNPVLIREGVQS